MRLTNGFFLQVCIRQHLCSQVTCEPPKKKPSDDDGKHSLFLSLSLSLSPPLPPDPPVPPRLKGDAKQTQARELDQGGHALSHVWVP